METSFKALQLLVPELSALLLRRYKLLANLQFSSGLGRRLLSEKTGLTERETRNEADLLRSQGLIHISPAGMSITELGLQTLQDLQKIIRELSGTDEMETRIRDHFKLAKVIIVPGESDEEEITKALLGQRTAIVLGQLLKDKMKIAVTGGSSIASIEPHLQTYIEQKKLMFLAARGGMTGIADVQANTIVSKFAEKLNGIAKTLYLPEQMSDEAYDAMIKEPVIREMLLLYENADVVLHGIGDAQNMATRRQVTEEDLENLKNLHAVGEAFGYYFNEDGEPVHRIKTVGIQLHQVEKTPHVIAVAGGTSKAKAIGAYLNKAPSQTILITDEGAAKKILQTF